MLVALVAAGCTDVGGPASDALPAPTVPPLLEPVCSPAARALDAGSACAVWLGVTPGRNLEASLAVSPLDPDHVLAAWTVREKGEAFSRARVLAALSTDGGSTWQVTQLRDPSVTDLPGASRYSFDQRAGFGPDGTAFVLYGGEMQRYATLADGISRITLASSSDGGASWRYSRVAEMPGVVWDYFGFAIAPDDGALYVATDELASGGVWTWRSLDSGATWEGPTLAYASAAAPDGLHRVPSLAAGPDGFLVLVTQAALDTRFGESASGVAALVSHDGGASFGEERVVASGSYFGLVSSPAVMQLTNASAIPHVLVSDTEALFDVSSLDGGETWEEPRRLAAASGGAPYWGVLSVAPDGTTYVMTRNDAADGTRATIELHQVPVAREGQSRALAIADAIPNAGNAGDDYGGIALGRDGALYVAFSDPRVADEEQIAFIRLARAAG